MWKKIKENLTEHFDTPSLTVISITFVLFVIALFTKKFWHDLSLELAIFLVSLKLIMSAYHHSVVSKRIEKRVTQIQETLNDEKK